MCWSAAYETEEEDELWPIYEEQARLAKAIARFEPVTVLAHPEDAASARRFCGPVVQVKAIDLYDLWARDTLPSFVSDPSGKLRAVTWNFNAWGNKDNEMTADWTLAKRAAGTLGVTSLVANIIAEGGAIEVDGEGTLLTTETCLLNPNRNPGISKREIERELAFLTGATKVIWLPGSTFDTVTDGHIDGIARFVAPGAVLAEVTDDRQDPEYEELKENAKVLERATDAKGRKLEVIRIYRPRWEYIRDKGDDFAATYVNFYIANGGVIMGKYGDPKRDEEARALLAELFPARQIVQIRYDEICEGGGGIHCSTQQVPVG